VTSEPVTTPVISSKYFLKKELPDLGTEVYTTLLVGYISTLPSKNLGPPSNIHFVDSNESACEKCFLRVSVSFSKLMELFSSFPFITFSSFRLNPSN
jgi:hypothetical protein